MSDPKQNTSKFRKYEQSLFTQITDSFCLSVIGTLFIGSKTRQQSIRRLFLYLDTEVGFEHAEVHSLAFKESDNDPALLPRLTTKWIEESPQRICKRPSQIRDVNKTNINILRK